MALEHRIADKNGQRLNYTCENKRFKTNVKAGFAHGSCRSRGSVFKNPLCVGENGYTLWLEHVTNLKDPKDQCYWLMWYQDGIPTIPLSGIMRRKDIPNLAKHLADFVP